MLDDSVNAALEEQERNKHKKRQKEREKNINKINNDKNNTSYSNKIQEDKTIPLDSFPGDSEEINIDNHSTNKINLPINIKKLKSNKNENIINNNNINKESIKLNKKKIIPLPKSNIKYNSKSPDQNKIRKQKEIKNDLSLSMSCFTFSKLISPKTFIISDIKLKEGFKYL